MEQNGRRMIRSVLDLQLVMSLVFSVSVYLNLFFVYTCVDLADDDLLPFPFLSLFLYVLSLTLRILHLSISPGPWARLCWVV